MGNIFNAAVAEIRAGLRSEESLSEMKERTDKIAQDAADYAKTLAPVGTAAEHDAAPGTFRDSIRWRELRNVSGLPAAQVYSDAVNPAGHKYSLYVEYGSRGHAGAGTFAATAKYIQQKSDSERD